MKNITIKDIARMAGVSPRTVSRVINNDPKAKKETRVIVQKVIAETGFQVNMLAKGLRGKKTKTLVAFVDKHQGHYWGVFHNEMLQQMLREAQARNYRMVIASSSAESYEQEEEDGFNLLRQGLADGAIMFDSIRGDRRVEHLRAHSIPFVLIGKDADYFDTSYVDLDNVYVGYMGAQYLHERGRSHMVLMLGGHNYIVCQERTEGFNRYVQRHPEVKGRVIQDVGSIEEAHRQTLKLLSEPSRPDAIFISGDERAIGVYSAIYEKGLRIPEDIAVLGVDKIQMGQYFQPPITTIDQSISLIVKYAFDFLLLKLESDDHNARRIQLTPVLCERKSV